jgi:hypothetical protein
MRACQQQAFHGENTPALGVSAVKMPFFSRPSTR